jgi:tol-pal system protein YbgF
VFLNNDLWAVSQDRTIGMSKMRNLRKARLLHAAAFILCGVTAGAVGALADAPVSISPRIARQLNSDELQARADALQSSPHYLRVADLFGESDEEKQARLAKEQAQDAGIAQANQKIDDLQDSVRRMTGQIEQLDHKLNDAYSRMDRMQRDFDYKICTMTAQQLGESADSGGLPCAAQTSGAGASPPQSGMVHLSAPPLAQQQGSASVHLAPPPSVLGTIPSNQPLPLAAPGSPDDSSAPAQSNTRPQFDAAMKLLSRAQYDEARAAFSGFVSTNPKDALAPQAEYWVGDIAYVQKDYANAARAFAEGIKKYGSSPRAPDSMLKLGQSLLAMNQKQEGCTTLGALSAKYPQASPNVLGQAKAARKAAGCK